MDEILLRYKRGQFKKCLEVIKLLPESDNLIDNLMSQNCLIVCESIVRILENDPDKLCESQEQLYLFFDKVTSLGTTTEAIPFQLKLTVTFNLLWWLLFYVDNEMNEDEIDEYLELVNTGLTRVLGKNISPSSSFVVEEIFLNLRSLKSVIPQQDYATTILILELTIVVVVCILKLKKTLLHKCSELVAVYVTNLKQVVKSLESIDNFLNVKSMPLFKFGLNKMAALSSEANSAATDCLYLLESVLLYSMEDFKNSLKALQKNSNCSLKSLWYYLGVLNSFKLENWDLCLGFLTKASSLQLEVGLKARFAIMQGMLCGVERNHKEALKHFGSALNLMPTSCIAYYCIGQECGKMGLYDVMVDNFEKLVEVITNQEFDEVFKPNFETIILDWLHPPDEITEIEALYGLAVSYGLNERFHKATETYEKILQSVEWKNKSVTRMPDILTILHEASIMNLLTGNLVRAEQIALDAVERYTPREPNHDRRNDTLSGRDVEWLEILIEQELLESDLEAKELKAEILYPEDVIYFFPQNVVAMLILSEIQRIQEIEEYKITLSKVLSVFSKYLSSMQKKEVVSENEQYVWTLVKALAGKTCLKIALLKIKDKDTLNIEKMFKRSLSCNKGDKDALFNYYMYLLNEKRRTEAFRLWNTFHKEETTVREDSLQSFSLRYFLGNKITKRELEKVQKDIEGINVEVS